MTKADPKAMLRQLYDDVLGRGQIEVLDALFAPNFVDRNTPVSQKGSKEFFRNTVIAFREAFPHATWTIDDVMVVGDVVTAKVSWQGKHEGEFMGVEPTGQVTGATSVSSFRIANGQFIEHWSSEASSDVPEKLGMTALPGSKPGQG